MTSPSSKRKAILNYTKLLLKETMLTRSSLRIKQAVDTGRIQVDAAAGVVFGRRGQPLKPRLDSSGAPMVSFLGDYAYIHRVVAYVAFGESALQPGVQVRHLNGDPTDNRAANLALQTPTPLHARDSRAPYGQPPSAMPWKVVDPASGRAVAHFVSHELAAEYARFKFGDLTCARPRARTSPLKES